MKIYKRNEKLNKINEQRDIRNEQLNIVINTIKCLEEQLNSEYTRTYEKELLQNSISELTKYRDFLESELDALYEDYLDNF